MKKIALVLLGILIIGAVWYVFFKPGHYKISFITKEPQGLIHDHISNWKLHTNKDKEVSVLNITSSESEINQMLTINDSTFNYNWSFEKINDSTTKVIALIEDTQNNIAQKIQAPFTKNNFVKRSISNVQKVKNEFNRECELFRAHSIERSSFNGGHCAYITLESPLNRKATAMVTNIATVMDYVNENNLKLSGDPYVEVFYWDKEKDFMRFNFCFPIVKSDTLPTPSNPDIKFKETPALNGLKIEFNGNYSISYRSWFYLYREAKKLNKKPTGLPTEIFLNDPHEGGSPLEWKAHIFLPLEE